MMDGTPIGYTAYLPYDKEEIKGILVDVYGGKLKERDSEKIQEKLIHRNLYLTKHNVMVVYLNLPDVLKDSYSTQVSENGVVATKKSYVQQGEMPESIFIHLQNAIHHFYDILKRTPEKLHEELGSLLKDKNIPMNLFGHSFGGLMSVRQAELFPDTWDGYISAAGSLSLKTIRKTSIAYDMRKFPTFDPNLFKYLYPEQNLMTLKDPVLILNNLDDNITSLKVATSFYNEAVKEKKENLIYPLFTYEGVKWGRSGGLDKPITFGHSGPSGETRFREWVETIHTFVTNIKSITKKSPYYQWQGRKGYVKSHEYDVTSSATKMFLAAAYKQYKKNVSLTHKRYKEIFFSLKFLSQLIDTPSKLRVFIDQINWDSSSMKEVLKQSLLRDLSSIKTYSKEYKEINDEMSRNQNPNFKPDIKIDELLSNSELFLKTLLSHYNKEFFIKNISYKPDMHPMEKLRQKRLLRNLLFSNFTLVSVPNNQKKVWEDEFVEAFKEFKIFLKKKDKLKELIAETNETKDLIHNK
jgi:hypothetical protein